MNIEQGISNDEVVRQSAFTSLASGGLAIIRYLIIVNMLAIVIL